MVRDDAELRLGAMKNEYTIHCKGIIHGLARPSDKKILSNRWLFKAKRSQDGEIEIYKVRLVARGNMESTTRKSLLRL